ncbi:hypothetical protein [Micromonospora humi]|uniref:hypothetical protein n=1 Tax=Micromonospora humi TaxID=745366 RepID=UPI001FE1D2C3|nr:hypothetical protein [Micromonospora humi]
MSRQDCRPVDRRDLTLQFEGLLADGQGLVEPARLGRVVSQVRQRQRQVPQVP